ncbi:ran-binding protein [Astrocystis sublimbata]|nr:ran-binding protein [Astrocystis sublimbata]
MSNPFRHGSPSTNPDGTYHSYLPRLAGSYASVVSGSNLPLASPSLRANRMPYILNSGIDSSSELYSTLPSSRSSMADMERNDHSPDGRIPGLTSQSPRLPPLSRKFEMFMPRGGVEEMWATPRDNTSFFIPTYLRGTTYIAKLEADQRAKETPVESSSPDVPLGGQAPASHLGMTFDLIERAPTLSDQYSAVPPLPTRWNKDDKHGALELSADGLEVRCNPALRTTREHDHEISSIRADHPMPSQAGIYYFEVTLLTKRRDETSTVCIGFAAKASSLARPTGWEPESWGYHGDDGDIYTGGNVGKKYKDTNFRDGDVIGCGVNFRTSTAFFTKNGTNLGTAFRDMKGKLYPVVGIKKAGEYIRVNFGQKPFIFKIDQMIEKEQATIKQAMIRTSIGKLASPHMNETEFLQKLVLQFLQHDGYVEAAQEFAKELFEEQQALNIDPSIPIVDVNIKDDEDARQRQVIRRAILQGDVDRALALTNKQYPGVLTNNQDVYFKVKCQKFIEMVRANAEPSPGNSKKNSSQFYKDIPNEMDLDENGPSDAMEDDPMETQPEPSTSAGEMIAYGQTLQAEFKNDPRPEVVKTLNEIFALLAYPDPLHVKEVAPLLDQKARVAVAEELNSAILSSIGKSSQSALENMYGQTTVLLDYLQQDGGPGSFVSIQSVMDDISKPRTS